MSGARPHAACTPPYHRFDRIGAKCQCGKRTWPGPATPILIPPDETWLLEGALLKAARFDDRYESIRSEPHEQAD